MARKPMRVVDAAIYNFLTMGVIFPWAYVWGRAYFPGANLELAVLLTLAAQIPISVAYAFLSTVLPSRGGDYVYQFRAFGPLGYVIVMSGFVLWILQWVALSGWLFTYLGLGPLIATIGINQNNEALTLWVFKKLLHPSGVGAIIVSFSIVFVAVRLLSSSFIHYVRLQRVLFTLTIASIAAMITVFAAGDTQCQGNLNSFVETLLDQMKQSSPASSSTGFVSALVADVKTYGINIPPIPSLSATLWVVPMLWTSLQWATYSVEQNDEIENAHKLRSQLWIYLAPAVCVALTLAILPFMEERALSKGFLVAAAKAHLTDKASGESQFILRNWLMPFPNVLAMASTKSTTLVVLIAIGFLANAFQITCNCFIGMSRILARMHEDRALPISFESVTPVPADALLVRMHWLYVFLAIPWILAYNLVPNFQQYSLGVTFAAGYVFIFTALAAVRIPSEFSAEWKSSTVASLNGRWFRVFGILGFLAGLPMVIAYLWSDALGLHDPAPMVLVVMILVGSVYLYRASRPSGMLRWSPGELRQVAHAPSWRQMIQQWIHDLLRHATVLGIVIGLLSLLVAVGSLSLSSYIASLKDDVDAASAALDAERSQNTERLLAKDAQIHDLLASAATPSPLLVSPADGGSSVDNFVILSWLPRVPDKVAPGYVVEVTPIGSDGIIAQSRAKRFVATDPGSCSTRFPFALEETLERGSYLWRVAEAEGGGEDMAVRGAWSGSRSFSKYDSVIDRIRSTRKLLVGASFIQDSKFMLRDHRGSPTGFDYTLVTLVARELSGSLGVADSIVVKVSGYPSIDSALFTGLLSGETDVAIGSITRTSSRENQGIRFTDGYFCSHVVLVASARRKWPRNLSSVELTVAHKVGAIAGTTNAAAAQRLRNRAGFQLVEMPSVQHLLMSLELGSLDFVIIDEPLAQPLIEQRRFVVIRELGVELEEYYKEDVGPPYQDEYAIACTDSTLHMHLQAAMRSKRVRTFLNAPHSEYHFPHGTCRPCVEPVLLKNDEVVQ